MVLSIRGAAPNHGGMRPSDTQHQIAGIEWWESALERGSNKNLHQQAPGPFFALIQMFFARAVLVHDLQPLALPCCSKDYGKAKSSKKRISLRKREIKQAVDTRLYEKQEFIYTHSSTVSEYWAILENPCIHKTCYQLKGGL